MRTIKFRGKRIDGQGWVYGFYLLDEQHKTPRHCIWTREFNGIGIGNDITEVLPESVGQWTGLVDRHGKEIFEGDVIRFTRNTGPIYKPTISSDVCVVRWVEEKSSFRLCYRTQRQKFHTAYSDKYEIIGNIHDNPELMEVE